MGFQTIFSERPLKLSASFVDVNKSDIPQRCFTPDSASFSSRFLVSPEKTLPREVDVYGGPHCLDQKTDLIREPGDSQSPALSFWGSGSAQVSAANRSGATAPKRRPSLLLVYGRAIGPFTVTFPWYTSHGVSYAKLW